MRFHWKKSQRSGDGAEDFISGVATKRVRGVLYAMQEEHCPEAVSEDHVDLFSQLEASNLCEVKDSFCVYV